MPKIIINASGEAYAEPTLNQQPREIVEYRWDRIIGAALLLSVLIAALVWGGAHLFTPEDFPDATPVAQGSALNNSTRSPETSPAAPVSSPAAEAVSHSPAPATRSDEAATLSGPGTGAAVTTLKPAAASTPAKVLIHSSKIRRAQLTTNVIDSQPVDQVPVTIAMNPQGLLRIYLFTETTGLGGRKLYHDWFLEGKRMARVQLPARQRTVTVSSSKFIDRHMTGSWTVNIRDDRNSLLATATFEVVR